MTGEGVPLTAGTGPIKASGDKRTHDGEDQFVQHVSPLGAGDWAPQGPTVVDGTAGVASLILGARPKRRRAVVINVGGTYVRLGKSAGAVLTSSIRLDPGLEATFQHVGPIYGYVDS